MPFVEINVWKENMDDSKKEKLIKEVSQDVSEIVGTPLYAVEVIINEIPKANWGKGGIQSSKWIQGQFSPKG
ncbi:MAG: 4-oxalocrotonate tautomerase [Candidatus Aenigmarchaeota archaeon]|nr:4-oxalocrotonate tautomerase [Candidatus Aenigmarchaeota archaeon]